jgi:hypothetical protein
VLVEKQATVPDTYPLTLNALVSGCNQKSSRDPVLQASDAEVQAALDRLKSLSLVVESSGGRVMRYGQNVGRVLGIPPQSVALLAVLFLRGPQTPGEIRINSERLHRFGDLLAVDAFLRELAERPAGALVMELPRAPGAREARWTHLLGDVPQSPAAAPAASGGHSEIGGRPRSSEEAPSLSEMAALRAQVDRLQADVDSLKDTVARITRELGLA